MCDGQAFDDHLSWAHRPTPFISFFNNWGQALARRRWLLEEGANNVTIIAVWVKDLHYVHDAYDIATALRYTDDNRDGARQPRQPRQLRHHFGEFLVEGGIRADDYRILATFDGDGPERLVSLSIPRLRVEVMVPGDFAQSAMASTPTQKLEDEVYSCTGVKCNQKFERLVCRMGNVPSLIGY
jgi:hypothetical protein